MLDVSPTIKKHGKEIVLCHEVATKLITKLQNSYWLLDTDECTLILHTWICIFTHFDTYALWKFSAPFKYLQHLYVLQLQNVLHTCPPSLSILSCVHTSCISTSPNTQHHLHMCYNVLPEPSHICRHPFISHHIPDTLYHISEHLPAQKHTYTEYPILFIHGTQNIRNTFGNIWTPIHSIIQHS